VQLNVLASIVLPVIHCVKTTIWRIEKKITAAASWTFTKHPWKNENNCYKNMLALFSCTFSFLEMIYSVILSNLFMLNLFKWHFVRCVTNVKYAAYCSSHNISSMDINNIWHSPFWLSGRTLFVSINKDNK
jgi:hypothetical protein